MMRKIYFLPLVAFVILFISTQVYGQALDPFITIWKTDNDGVTGSSAIRIPAFGEFTYQWEEVGNPSNNGSGTGNNTTDITFPAAGTYQVSMTPSGASPFHQIQFGEYDVANYYTGGDWDKLLDITQWGDVEWSTMEDAYRHCTNLTLTATDAPDLSKVSNMSGTFRDCLGLQGTNLPGWDVSNVTNMAGLFSSTYVFNQPIDSWDVSKVTDMSEMFYMSQGFNQDLNSWDVSKVTTMYFMFDYCINFNGNISNWDVSSVTNMGYMFDVAQSFNHDIGGWDVSKVTNMDFLFGGAMAFNQSLGKWNLTSLTSAFTMLQTSGIDCEHYSQTLYGWANNVNTPSSIDLNYTGPLHYGPMAVTARNYLINTLGWNILADTEDPNCIVVLPVKLISFEASKIENQAVLRWKTASESNSSHFEIERSTDARKFEYLGSVEGHGTVDQEQTYTFIHKTPATGTNYYRLKQVDLDGKFAYSRISAVKFDEGTKLILYPNPASNAITISGHQGDGIISVYDISGRLVIQRESVRANEPVSIANLKNGLYQVRFLDENGNVHLHKFIK